MMKKDKRFMLLVTFTSVCLFGTIFSFVYEDKNKEFEIEKSKKQRLIININDSCDKFYLYEKFNDVVTRVELIRKDSL